MRLWPRRRVAGITLREKEIALLLLQIQERKLIARIARHAMAQPPQPTTEWLAMNSQLEIMFNRVRNRIRDTSRLETLPPRWWDRWIIAIARWALGHRT